MNIMKHRTKYFIFSGVLITLGFISMAIWGLPLSIDFTGGSLLETRFESGNIPELPEIRALYDAAGYDEAIVQSYGDDAVIIRTQQIDTATNNDLIEEMEAAFNDDLTILRFESVGPTVGREVASRAAGAVALAALGMLIYIWLAFRGVANAHRYGISALSALIHDVVMVIGIQAMLGRFFGWEVDALFLTAMLTIIGYSVLDSIVVFDRIRENTNIYRRVEYETIVNHSVVQTLDRSLNTQLTVLFPMLALALFGGATIRHFVVILILGLISGTYSSIFHASPLLVVWDNWANRRK